MQNLTAEIEIVHHHPPTTLGQALDVLLADTERRIRDGIRSPATLEMQRSHARWLCCQLGERYPLENLTGSRLLELAERWRVRGGEDERPISLSTLAKRLTTLRRAMRLMVQRDELDALPLFPEIGRPPWRPRKQILCSYAQLCTLLHALPQERQDWVTVAVWTCQRPGDVERMRWRDVDIDADPPWTLIRSTKTRRPDGIKVKCPAPMITALKARRERLIYKGREPRPEDRLVDAWPGVSRTLPVVCVRNGLPPMSAIDLRHTGFSWMVRRKGITRAAQDWGGWSDFNMLSKYYAHSLPAGLEDASDELASIVDEDENQGDKGRRKK